MAAADESFEALDAFLDDYLELPVKGRDGQTRVYRIEDPPAEDGIRIEKITTLAARLAAGGTAPSTELLSDEEERDLYRMCLGAAYDRLMADVSWGRFKHVATTAMFWVVADKETAAEFWRTGQQPGKAANRAARRAQERRASSGSGGASTTRSQGSTSGTRASRRRRRPRDSGA